MTILACCYSELTNKPFFHQLFPSRHGYHSVKKYRMLGDSGIAITLTKCRACSATMHILMEAKRNITAK
jgi:hypothetical protein